MVWYATTNPCPISSAISGRLARSISVAANWLLSSPPGARFMIL